MKKYAILAATGQIGRMTAQYLLDQTDAQLVLFGHQATSRLADFASDRVSLVDGDLTDEAALTQAIQGTDGIFVAYVADPSVVRPIIKVMDQEYVQRFVVMSVPDLYQEVSGPFQAWYRQNTGLIWQTTLVEAAQLVEDSGLDYAILRTTWLYNDSQKLTVEVTTKDQPFEAAQVSRQAVAKFAGDLLTGQADYHQANLGIGEPNTAWSKPSFY